MARRAKISVGNNAASATVLGADTLLSRSLKNATKAVRAPLEAAMREIFAGVKRDWPRPTPANRGGNRRRKGKGFNVPGWASSGKSHRLWRWSTRVAVRSGRGAITTSLTNDADRRGRYAFMARYPFPSRKFYWRELALKPAKKRGKLLIKELADQMYQALAKG